VDPAKYMTISS